MSFVDLPSDILCEIIKHNGTLRDVLSTAYSLLSVCKVLSKRLVGIMKNIVTNAKRVTDFDCFIYNYYILNFTNLNEYPLVDKDNNQYGLLPLVPDLLQSLNMHGIDNLQLALLHIIAKAQFIENNILTFPCVRYIYKTKRVANKWLELYSKDNIIGFKFDQYVEKILFKKFGCRESTSIVEIPICDNEFAPPGFNIPSEHILDMMIVSNEQSINVSITYVLMSEIHMMRPRSLPLKYFNYGNYGNSGNSGNSDNNNNNCKKYSINNIEFNGAYPRCTIGECV